MRAALVILALITITCVAQADPSIFRPAAGPPNPIGSGRDVCWSEPPDLNGLIATSEIIANFGIYSECANDFVPMSPFSHVSWGGGYYGTSTPCESGYPTPGFNLFYYEDAGCLPGTLFADFSRGIGEFTETFLGCQSQCLCPMYQWEADAYVELVPGNLYWFSAQMKDHPFPGQAGRLSAATITGCESVLKSAYFGFPDWTPCSAVFGVSADWSQEWQCCCGPSGACCFPDGTCEEMDAPRCEAQGGVWQGENTSCSSNPCGPSPVLPATWGEIRALYR